MEPLAGDLGQELQASQLLGADLAVGGQVDPDDPTVGRLDHNRHRPLPDRPEVQHLVGALVRVGQADELPRYERLQEPLRQPRVEIEPLGVGPQQVGEQARVRKVQL